MIQWNEYYRMGIEDFDNDHKQLFKIASRIIDMVQQSMDDSNTRLHIMREGIKYLRSYFDNHALREEAYMRKIGYADYAAHKQMHDEFQQIQLVKYEKILENDNCTKEDILDFVGSGIGWLLEHITTADMAIVGKGFLSKPKVNTVNSEVLENEINHLFVATLNMDVHARIIQENYQGENFGQAVYQLLTYRRGENIISVMAGIEKKFMLSVANMIYGDEIDQADALIISTFEIFSANFWKTLAARFVIEEGNMQYQENHFLTQKQLQQQFLEKKPILSVLFECDKGKFFLSSDDKFLEKNYKMQ